MQKLWTSYKSLKITLIFFKICDNKYFLISQFF